MGSSVPEVKHADLGKAVWRELRDKGIVPRALLPKREAQQSQSPGLSPETLERIAQARKLIEEKNQAELVGLSIPSNICSTYGINP